MHMKLVERMSHANGAALKKLKYVLVCLAFLAYCIIFVTGIILISA